LRGKLKVKSLVLKSALQLDLLWSVTKVEKNFFRYFEHEL